MSDESACESRPPARPACTALAFLDTVHGRSDAHPHERFEARVAAGASLLGIAAGAVNLPLVYLTHTRLQGALVAGLVVALGLQLLGLRRGAPMRILRWTLLGTAAIFLIGSILAAPRLESRQLYWLVVLPLAAQTIAARRGLEPLPAISRGLLVTLGLVIVVGALLVFVRDAGSVPPAPWNLTTRVELALDYATFIVAVYGVAYVHDLSARDMQLELTQLRRVLSVCAWCKRIHAGGDWVPFEIYLAEHESHALERSGVCPSCYERDFWE
jgi:hypothetical protein